LSASIQQAVNQQQLDTFIDHLWLEDGLSKNTLDSYRNDLTAFTVWCEQREKVNLDAVTNAHIQQYLAVKHVA
jgi:integrase/recombinase XerD